MKIDNKIEAEIDALLERGDSESVIDSLLAMPRHTAANADDEAWEKLLHARLQARLAQKMRALIDEDPRKPKPGRRAA